MLPPLWDNMIHQKIWPQTQWFGQIKTKQIGGQPDDTPANLKRLHGTSVALQGFPGDLEHWLKLRGGNVIQKYLYTPNFSPIGQLDAEIWHFGPHFWPQLRDPWTNPNIFYNVQSTNLCGVYIQISASQVQNCGSSSSPKE